MQQGYDLACIRDIVDAARSLDPKELRSAASYRDAVLARFFPSGDGPRRLDTPFDKLTDRGVGFLPGELVIVNGINGHGKTSFLSQIVLHLLRQGALCCIASMEIKPDALLHRMTIQAAATAEPAPAFVEFVQDYWDGRLWMFDVVGTAKSDYLLDVFRYARACYGITWFVIDSLAKCGIDEEDYKAQKRFVDALCDFKNETDATVFLVTHSRKLESETRTVDKMDIKGTGAIADLADTVTTLWRNKAKEARRGDDDDSEHVVDDPEKPDAIWYWQKNRNGDFEKGVGLWFHAPTRQFLQRADAPPRAYVSFVRDASLDIAI
jgi:twinkle protein